MGFPVRRYPRQDSASPWWADVPVFVIVSSVQAHTALATTKKTHTHGRKQNRSGRVPALKRKRARIDGRAGGGHRNSHLGALPPCVALQRPALTGFASRSCSRLGALEHWEGGGLGLAAPGP